MQTRKGRKAINLLLVALVVGLCTCTGATDRPETPASRLHVQTAAQPALTSTEAHSSSPNRGLLQPQHSQQSCGRIPREPLSAAITSCSTWQQHIGCAFLETQGYIPPGVQSFVPPSTSGNFSIAETCGSSTVSVATQQQILRFEAGKRTVLAVVSRGAGTAAYFFGRGASKGVISLQQQPSELELCLAPATEGSVQVQQSATYAPRLAPGSVSWQLKKTVQVPPAFTDGVVQMMEGDSVEAAWTLAATKSGEEASYHALVTGSISISNTKQEPMAVFGVLTAVTGGPSATVDCGTAMPFKVPACGTSVCTFTAEYAQPPAAGTYHTSSTVQYQEPHKTQVAVATVKTTFKVATGAAALTPAAARVPAGQALVTDSQLPGQTLTFTGSGQQSYVTVLKCPASGSVINSATLLAATGQQVTTTAHVQKNCHRLDVRLVDVGEPLVARWHWSVQQTANTARVNLRSVSASNADFANQQVGNMTSTAPLIRSADAEEVSLPPTEDVTYTVRVTRTLPKGADGKVAPYTLAGKVIVTNPAPMNVKLAGVTVRITDPSDASQSITVGANCPIFAVASGQSLTCSWTATPTFNPTGAAIVAVAQYVASLNGAGPFGETVAFESAPVIAGDERIARSVQDGPSTFGGTFTSIKRALLQWAAPSSNAPTFSPAAFLNRVWGSTGATTIVTPGVQPVATLTPGARNLPQAPAVQHLYRPSSSSGSTFAAPALLTSLPKAGPSSGDAATSLPQLHMSAGNLRKPGLVGKDTSSRSGSSTAVATGSAAASKAAGVDAHKRLAGPDSSSGYDGSRSSNSLNAAAAADGSAGGVEAAAGSAASVGQPLGLLDDCADVSHELGFEPGLLSGRVVSGKPPSGRICGSSVFVYSVRYGPYDSCSTGRKAAATVRLMTADTRRVGSSVSEVDVSITGCKAGLHAVVAAARATADVEASWNMQMHAQHTQLQLVLDQSVNNTYTVSFNRHLRASAPRLFVIVSLQNMGHSTPLIGDASYTMNMTCGAHAHVRSSAFACASNKAAPGSTANCSFVVPLPCVAQGSLQAQLQLSTGELVKTAVTPFQAPDLEQLVAAKAAPSACIKVSYGKAGQTGEHKLGRLVAGHVPQSTLCASATYNFTRDFGPFKRCVRSSAMVSAGYTTADGVTKSETLLTALDPTSCRKQGATAAATATGASTAAGLPAGSHKRVAEQQQTQQQAHTGHRKVSPSAPKPAARQHARIAVAHGKLHSTISSSSSSNGSGSSSSSKVAVATQVPPGSRPPRGSCVYQPWFWKHCMLPDLPGEPACDIIMTSLPGGKGPKTPFFPYRKDPYIRRTYRQLMVAPRKTGNSVVDLHFHAARVFIAAQLNHYAGVGMPTEVREAYMQLGRDYFSVYDDRMAAEQLPSKPEVRQRVADAANVLAAFTSGKWPGIPTCAVLQQQMRKKQSG